MIESGLRRQLIQLLSPLHAVPVESPLTPGIPDLNCIAGWIELKNIHRWPMDKTIVQPPHFKPEQRLWLKKRCASGGSAWLLLQVGREWCLVWGAAAAEHLGVSWRRADLVVPSHWLAYWPAAPSSADLIRNLLQRRWSSI